MRKYKASILHKKRPLKKSRRPQTRIRPKRMFFLGLFFLAIGGILYFFFLWPGFWIKQININLERDSTVDVDKLLAIVEDKTEGLLFNTIAKKNVFIFSTRNLQASILESLPQLAEVNIIKRTDPFSEKGSVLEVNTIERKTVAIWCKAEKIILEEETNEEIVNEEELENNEEETSEEELKQDIEEKKIEQCFYIDKEGVVYKESPATEGSLILSIHDFRGLEPKLGDEVITPEFTDSLLSLAEDLSAFFKTRSSLSLNNLAIANLEIMTVQDLRVSMDNGWQIYLDAWQPFEGQLDVLKKVLNEMDDLGQITEYIDLRTKNRVYYK